MTTIAGNAGVFRSSTNSIGNVQRFTITASASRRRTTSMGDSAESYAAVFTSWQVSGEAYYIKGNTAQEDFIEGSTVAFEGYPEGNSAGLRKISGNVIVDQWEITNEIDNTVMVRFSATGTGAMTRGTV